MLIIGCVYYAAQKSAGPAAVDDIELDTEELDESYEEYLNEKEELERDYWQDRQAEWVDRYGR